MSDNKTSSQNSKKGRKKRKANSPLLADSGQCNQTGQTGFTNGDVSKRTVLSWNNLHLAEMANNLNFTQPSFGPQSPFVPQFIGASPPTFASMPSIPPWASDIIEELKSIKASVSKIDGIEKTINEINSKVNNLDKKVSSLDLRLTEVEAACNFHSDSYDDTKSQIENTKENIKQIDEKCKTLEESMKCFQNMESKITDLEARSLRDNLLFHGFKEESDEDCEKKITDMINTTLQIDKTIVFDRVHRLGQIRGPRPRPIVAKFHQYKDRELVRKTSYDHVDKLKAEGIGIGIQQTKAVLAKRREMTDVVNREKATGKLIKWAGAKLLVRDKSGGNYYEVTS